MFQQRSIKIENIARDQMEKYDKYIKNLKQKVEKQREERTKHQEELIERLQADITAVSDLVTLFDIIQSEGDGLCYPFCMICSIVVII